MEDTFEVKTETLSVLDEFKRSVRDGIIPGEIATAAMRSLLAGDYSAKEESATSEESLADFDTVVMPSLQQ